MREYVEIGSAPSDEDCVSVNRDTDYLPAMRAECKRFIEFIRKHMGPEPFGASLRIKTFPHDFGSYMEVVCEFDEGDEKAVSYAFACESDLPTTWDAPIVTKDSTLDRIAANVTPEQ